MAASQACLNRKIPHLINSGYPKDQAVAIAYSECEGKASPRLALPDDQSATWLSAFAKAYTESEDVDGAEKTAWEAVGLDPQTAVETLTGACAPEERLIAFGATVKAIDDTGRVGGYLVVWSDAGHRDLQGEYFTPETDLGLDWYPRRPALYHHGMDATLKAARIGVIDTLRTDSTGVWAEAQLDLHNKYARAVLELAKRGALGWSSGSVPHWVEVDPDGQIKTWPIVEGSLTPTPAHPMVGETNTHITTLKALGEGPSLEGLITIAEQTEPLPSGVLNRSDVLSTEVKTMNMQELIAKVLEAVLGQMSGVTLSDEQKQAIVSQVSGTMEQPAMEAVVSPEQVAQIAGQAKTEVIKAINEHLITAGALDAAKGAMRIESRAPSGNNNSGRGGGSGHQPRIQVRSKYHHLSAEDMSFLRWTQENVAGANKRMAPPPAQEFVREMAEKAMRDWEQGKVKLSVKAVQDIDAVKSDEIDYSTQASYGDEWVSTLWSDQLWENARLDNIVAPLFDMIDMPSNPYTLPLESGDPTVYHVAETKDEDDLLISGSGNPMPDSKLGTANTTLTSEKLALRVGFSAELEEDSAIPFANQARKQSLRAIEDAIDNVILNGDTTLTDGINYYGGTATNQKWTAFDGLRHLALVTTAANAVSGAGAAPTLAMIRQARFTLARAFAGKPNELALITSTEVFAKLLGLDEILTYDKVGEKATNITGQLAILDGMPVLVSNELALGLNTGFVHSSTGNNYGSIVIVHRPSWKVGYRRRVKATLDFLPHYDAYQLVVNARVALARQNADCAAVLYYLAV